MNDTSLMGISIKTLGHFPLVGETLTEFTLVSPSLEKVSLSKYKGKRKIISMFPAINSKVCAMSVRKFNVEASRLSNVVVLNVSADSPEAQRDFCAAEGIENVEVLSAAGTTFPEDYGVLMVGGGFYRFLMGFFSLFSRKPLPTKGVCARAVIVADENHRVLYSELLRDISKEPNYAEAIKAATA